MRLYHYFNKNIFMNWALVAHVYNPCYSGGRDQEDLGLKPALANSSQDPILKKPNTKKGWWSGSSGKYLSRKCEVLSLNLSTTKNKQINK
jgi:hypothetical protein